MPNTGTVPRRQAGLFMFRWRQTCLTTGPNGCNRYPTPNIDKNGCLSAVKVSKTVRGGQSFFFCLLAAFYYGWPQRVRKMENTGRGSSEPRIKTVTNPQHYRQRYPEVITAMPGAAVLKENRLSVTITVTATAAPIGSRSGRSTACRSAIMFCIGAESVILMGGNNTAPATTGFPTIRLWIKLSRAIRARAIPRDRRWGLDRLRSMI